MPKLTPSAKSFIALIRSSAAIRSPFPAARGCQSFLLVKAALLPLQVPFPFFVVPALGDDFGVSAPGFYAAIPFDPPCSVPLFHLHTLLLGVSGQVVGGKVLFLCNKHLHQHRKVQRLVLQQPTYRLHPILLQSYCWQALIPLLVSIGASSYKAFDG